MFLTVELVSWRINLLLCDYLNPPVKVENKSPLFFTQEVLGPGGYIDVHVHEWISW